MHVTVSIQPPPAAISQLTAALDAVRDDPDGAIWLEPNQWRLRLADFGYVTRPDIASIVDVLVRRLQTVAAPEVWLQDFAALPEAGDDSVWVGLRSKGDAVTGLAQQLPVWAHEVGFAIDRRSYRPRIRLAKVGPQTTVQYLQWFEGHPGYQSPPWSAEAVVLGAEKPPKPGQPRGFEVLREIEFGPADEF